MNKKRILSIVVLAFGFTAFSSGTLAVGGTCDDRACSNCTPPPIVEDGGGCPAGQYWIGDATSGFCRTSLVVCGAAQNFSCLTGGCTDAGLTMCSNIYFSVTDVTGITSGTAYAVKNVTKNICYSNNTTVSLSGKSLVLSSSTGTDPAYNDAIEVRSTSGTNCSGALVATVPSGQTRSISCNAPTPCNGDTSKVFIDGNCYSKITAIQDPTTTSILRAWLGEMLGSFVYIPKDVPCGDRDGPVWSDNGTPAVLTDDRWVCGQGGGVWIKSGNDISNTNSGNVGIGTTAAPTAKLEVNGEIKGFGTLPVGTIIDWYCPAATVNATNCNALLPSSWKICDGSTVSDAASPFNTKALPNLVIDKFVRGGKADYTNQAGVGGTNSQTVSVAAHSHTVAAHTHSVPTHSHTLNSHFHIINNHTHTINSHSHTFPSHTHTLSGHTHYVYGHTHRWANVHPQWESGDGKWPSGMDINSDGDGIYYLALNHGDQTLYLDTQWRDFNTGSPSVSNTGSWSGSVSGASTTGSATNSGVQTGATAASTSNAVASGADPVTPTVGSTPATIGTSLEPLTSNSFDNEPAYVNLMPIIRIK